MSRRIITEQFQSNKNNSEVDTYSDKLVKNIPIDIVAAWIVVVNLILNANNVPTNFLLWISFFIGLILTPLWTLKQTNKKNKPPAKTQALISTGSFFVWVFALGGPFATLAFYRPLYGSLLLILYTLIVPLINPREG